MSQSFAAVLLAQNLLSSTACLSNTAHNMGLSESDLKGCLQKVIEITRVARNDNPDVSLYSSSSLHLSKEVEEQWTKYTDYSPLTQRSLESIRVDTTMEDQEVLKKYFKLDKEGKCKLSIAKTFLQHIE